MPNKLDRAKLDRALADSEYLLGLFECDCGSSLPIGLCKECAIENIRDQLQAADDLLKHLEKRYADRG